MFFQSFKLPLNKISERKLDVLSTEVKNLGLSLIISDLVLVASNSFVLLAIHRNAQLRRLPNSLMDDIFGFAARSSSFALRPENHNCFRC